MGEKTRSVTLTVETTSSEQFVAIFEKLARQCAGFLLDGVEARIYGFREEEADEG